ncbi:hypothetical protein RUND412_010320 [Rhizina undulata]
MRIFSALLVAPLAVFALPTAADLEVIDLETANRPTVAQAAVQARKLLLSENIATLSTVFPQGERHGLEGQPIGLMDYYADCSLDGNPTLLAINIATSFKNAKEGSPISLSIRRHFAHGSFSPAAHPRLSLIGNLIHIPSDSEEAIRLTRCFTYRHPDAALWLPGNKIHESEWVRFEVETVYWIGGFGNVAYIGFIPLNLYKDMTLSAEDVEEVMRGESGEQGSNTLQRVLGGLRKFVFQG